MRIRFLFVGILLLFVAACGISPRNVRADGSVIVDVIGEKVYRIDGQLYFRSAMWDAIEHAHKLPGLLRIEFRIPEELLRRPGVNCDRLVDVMAASPVSIAWVAYVWTPPDEGSKRVLSGCEYPVLS
jgi:hypothetical protein